MIQKPEWWGFVDWNEPGDGPVKLLDNAPDEMKKKFDEWKKQKAEDEKIGVCR